MIKPRNLFKQIQPYIDTPEAIIITGIRRAGKTTALQYFYQQIPSDNKIFLDLENILNRLYFEEKNYERIKFTFETLGLDFTKKSYIFLDEIQLVKNLPSIVKYFIDHYKVKFFLTGSASFYLKNLFTESLSGRKYIFEIYPLTFKEFLIFKEVKLNIPEESRLVNPQIFDTISRYYDEYIQFGGFPAVVLKSNLEEKKKALEEIFSSFFQLEILQLGDFRRNKVIRDLILLLIQRIGSKLDIQKLSSELGISRPSIYEYISFLEGTYFIKLVKPFSKKKNAEIRKVPKVYLCDSGLANHFAKLDQGIVFENCVFQNLITKGEINYYQKKSGAEIDFILNKEIAYEIKLKSGEQDLKRLTEFSKKLGLKESYVVSRKYCDLENILYGFML
ncbi:MAG: ATP-binding protein [bacterium]